MENDSYKLSRMPSLLYGWQISAASWYREDACDNGGDAEAAAARGIGAYGGVWLRAAAA